MNMRKKPVFSKLPGILLFMALLSACVPAAPSPTFTPVPTETPLPAPTGTPAPTSAPTATTEAGIGAPGGAEITTCPPDVLPQPDWNTYCDPTAQIFIQYPQDSAFEVTSDGVPRAQLSVQPGTNLGEKYMEITWRNVSGECRSWMAEGYAPEMVETGEEVINGMEFTLESGADAGAGNYYVWKSYSTARADFCVSLNFVLHSTNPDNYPTPPAVYDEALESAIFSEIVDTFRWVSP